MYKSPERQAQANERRRRDQKESLREQLLRSGFRAFASRPSDIEAQVERRRDARGRFAPAAPSRPLSREERMLLREAEVEAAEMDERERRLLLREAELAP